MALKPLAAKTFVFNRNFIDDVASSVAMEPDFTEDRFNINFPKMLGYFYGDIVGSEGASVLCSDQPCRRSIINGDEFNKTALALQASAAPAPASWENGARPANEPPTPLASEGAQAGTGDSEPC